MGVSAATNWVFNFALAYFVAPAFHNIQWKTYIIFGVFCAVMTFQVFFMYPETVGRSLEEIDLIFETDIKPWRTHKIGDIFGEAIEHRKQIGAETEVKSDATHEEVV